MILAKLNPSEEHLMEFSLNVQGTAEQVTDVRFVIEGDQYSLSFPCKTENDKVTVRIPKLNENISPGLHETKLEVVIGDKIFTPMIESIEILENIKVNVKEDVKVQNPEIKVHLTQEEDFMMVEEHGHQLLKKNSLYYGIVGANKTLRSSIGFKTLDDLIGHLSS